MTVADKLTTIAENEVKVYEAGQKSMIDESKIIEKTVSGSVIAVDDVSEVPHDVNVQLSSDTVTDFSNINVRVSSKNQFKYPYYDTTKTTNGITFTDNGDSSITISGKATADAYFTIAVIDFGNDRMWNESPNNNGYYVSGCKHFFYNGNNKICSIIVPSGTDYSANPITVKPQIYKGNSIADAVTIYKPNADGHLIFRSSSPNLYITAETDGIHITAIYHKSWGMQTEYDRFWDAYQQNGNRSDYFSGFAGAGWNDETFKPKYDIAPTGTAQSLFHYCKIADIKNICARCGITLDLSQATNTNQLFYDSSVTQLPKINLSNSNVYRTFHGCTQLQSIDELVLSTSKTIDLEAFYNCQELVEIRFGGTIAKSIDLHWSKKLSMVSLSSIVGALSKTVTGQTITLPTTARTTYDNVTIGGAWDELVSEYPNWTFAYA